MIRDHVGATPLANLSNTLKADLERIWHGLAKVRYDTNMLILLNPQDKSWMDND